VPTGRGVCRTRRYTRPATRLTAARVSVPWPREPAEARAALSTKRAVLALRRARRPGLPPLAPRERLPPQSGTGNGIPSKPQVGRREGNDRGPEDALQKHLRVSRYGRLVDHSTPREALHYKPRRAPPWGRLSSVRAGPFRKPRGPAFPSGGGGVPGVAETIFSNHLHAPAVRAREFVSPLSLPEGNEPSEVGTPAAT
jgi:hypothetical protein